jgi:hypothetical protein
MDPGSPWLVLMIMFKLSVGKKLDIDSPQGFNSGTWRERLSWGFQNWDLNIKSFDIGLSQEHLRTM